MWRQLYRQGRRKRLGQGRVDPAAMNSRISKYSRDLCRICAAVSAFLLTTPTMDAQQPPLGPAEVAHNGRVITPPADVAAPPSDAMVLQSGLAMKVLKPGAGTEHPSINDCVTVSFIAWKRD